jgi:hypothetical protein
MGRNLVQYNPLESPSYPPYSADIFPLDFSLSGKAKSALIGWEIPDAIDLLGTITDIWNGISDPELQHVLRSWIKHVDRVIETGKD